ncbi:Clathrin interactor EPSIN 1 [Hibiscus syriacus]|uniref:Clathrin interactor EPSIN 1 n=1 Tax=Hibiscus syriacus TaxID=106335 RepID=A0A6A2WKW5_HIBSY|nr:clathrin interactor EPSIN 1-like [Hibiscus syriacus]KAE8656595.1 Clathrin interactor EPSIN 1 [Hibiscus syriacus]
MDFMKVFDQTVREIKREVNLKVLKVPEIEQKVLDATDDEPWGPHGTVLAEIAQATKKFSEFQMVMNVLWTRLGETGKDWRYVYKALTVIEYLISHGSERAVDDIIEHTFQISSLTSFEYVEPSGKDMGINVRKKAETIVGLLSNKEKIQEARNKAAANCDKYVGLSSSGITYKSGASSYSSGGFHGGGDRYGGLSSRRESDSYRDSYKESNRYGEEKSDTDTYVKRHQGTASENQGNSSKESRLHGSKDSKKKFSSKLSDSNKYSQSASTTSNNHHDEFDDFDPRGISNSKPAAGSSNQVDLFGPSLMDDLFDAPASVPMEKSAMNTDSADVDLFADATFVSAPTKVTHESNPQAQVDVFACQPIITPAASPTVDLFAASDPVVQPDVKGQVDLFASQPATAPAASPTVDLFSTADPVVQPTMAANIEPVNANIVDPFAAVPLNNLDGSDIFGSFTIHSDSASKEQKHDGNLNNMSTKSSQDSKDSQKKDGFQVKSGIWADSLSRGIIDLNISAPKKVSLADVGIVGGLNDVDEREKGPPTSFYMGRAMGSGSGLGKTGFSSTTVPAGEDDLFSNLGSHQQYQFRSFK